MPVDPRRHVDRRDRARRRQPPRHRRHPRDPRPGGAPAGPRAAQGVHRRRGAHAHEGGVERRPEDARGAARRTSSSCSAPPRWRRCCRRSEAAASDSLFSSPGPARDLDACCTASPATESIEIDAAAVVDWSRARPAGSFRDAVSALDQLATACSGRDHRRRRARRCSAPPTPRCCSTDRPGRRRRRRRAACDAIDAQADAGADLGDARDRPARPPARVFLSQQLGELPGRGGRDRRRAGPDRDPGRAVAAGDGAPAGGPAPRRARRQVREGADPRLPLELALVRICRPAGELDARGARTSASPRLEAAPGNRPAPPPAAAIRAGAASPAAADTGRRPRRPPPPATATTPPEPAPASTARPGRRRQLARRHRAGDRPPLEPLLALDAARQPARRPGAARSCSAFPQSKSFARDHGRHARRTARCSRRCSAQAVGGTCGVRTGGRAGDAEPEPRTRPSPNASGADRRRRALDPAEAEVRRPRDRGAKR